MRKNIKKAVDDVIKYIDELSYNDISTISEILEITGHLDLSDEHIFEIKKAVFDLVEEEGRYDLDQPEYEDGEYGLSFNIPFVKTYIEPHLTVEQARWLVEHMNDLEEDNFIRYNEAKTKAIKYAGNMGVEVDRAYILEGAYMFDKYDESINIMGIPFVIDRLTGNIHNQFQYFKEHDIAWDEKAELDFETGELLE